MKTSDVLKSFVKHESALREIFRASKRIPDSQYTSTLTEHKYLLVLSELVSNTQQTEMYTKLRSIFDDPSTTEHITATVCVTFSLKICHVTGQRNHFHLIFVGLLFQHEQLYWKGLIPEWALMIFMDKFSLSRTDALKQLADQDRVRTNNQNPLNLDSDVESP